MSEPFWEKSYRDETISAFGMQPNPEIIEFIHLFSKEWNVLEAGCGEAKNAIYLAKNGFTHINAFDLSSNAILKARKIASANGVQINAFIEDLRSFPWQENYDLIISYGTLHFVSKDEWHNFLNEAKIHTNHGGIHVMQIFTNTVPASSDIAEFAVGLAAEGELREIYNGWEILAFKSFVIEDEHPDMPKHFHAINKVVARRL